MTPYQWAALWLVEHPAEAKPKRQRGRRPSRHFGPEELQEVAMRTMADG